MVSNDEGVYVGGGIENNCKIYAFDHFSTKNGRHCGLSSVLFFVNIAKIIFRPYVIEKIGPEGSGGWGCT